MGKLTINYVNGALGSVAPSQDEISGLVFVTGESTTGITGIINSSDGYDIIQISSIEQAITAGITSTAYPVVNHQLTNFFLMKPDGLVWLSFITDTGTTYTELQQIQKYTEGKIRQFGIYDTRELSDTILSNINTQLVAIRTAKMNVIGIVGMDTSSLTYTSLEDLSASSYSRLSVMIGQDGDSTLSGSTSLPEVGAVLGRTAEMAVNVSPAYNRLNVYDSITTNPALGDGTPIKELSDSYLETNVDDKNYMRFQKYVGDNSVYLNQSFMATSRTDDYKSIELNRVMDKAGRSINIYLTKELNSPIELDSDGNISSSRQNELETIAGTGLSAMKGAGEISDYKVTIDPTQEIISTNILYVVAKIIPYATANEIIVSLGFATEIA